MISQTDYVDKHDGQVCPSCESYEIEPGHLEVELTFAHQEMTCLECNFEWFDEYILNGWVPR